MRPNQWKTGQSHGGVVLAHPGTQHSYETALGLAEAGLLQRYVTGFYYDPDGVWGRAARRLPNAWRARAERELLRRHKPGLDPAMVETLPAAELAYVATARLGAVRAANSLLAWRNHRFDGRVARILERERPAAIHGYNTCALRMFRAARALGILCILDQSIAHIRTGLRLMEEERSLTPQFADSLPEMGGSAAVAQADCEAREADRVLAPSEFVRQSLVENGVAPERIFLMPYGAETERFRPGPRRADGVFRVLFVGHLSQRKGIGYLLEAFRSLKLPNAELVLMGGLAGGGQGLAKYRDSFRHVAPVPHAELPEYYQQADIFVLPSLYEGSALVIYEALASGLPVITTPNSGSVVRDGMEGFVVPIRDARAVAEKIARLYEDRALCQATGAQARRRAEEFPWSAYRRRLAEFIRPLVAGAR